MAPEDQGQRPGPECRRQSMCRFGNIDGPVSELAGVGQMNDQRMVGMRPKELMVAGFLAVLLIGYCLNRGIYTGAEIVEVGGYYKKRCTYLLPSGITVIDKGGWTAVNQAESEYCRLFHDSSL